MGVTERRERDRERRREEILDAAERVFVKRGFDEATMESVAAEAEVSKGTVYLYFESKDALRSAIAARNVQMMIARMDEHLADATTGLEGVRAILTANDAHFAERAHIIPFIVNFITDPPEADSPGFAEHRARVMEAMSRSVGAITRGQADGSIRKDLEPLLLTMQLWGSMLGVQLIKSRGPAMKERIPLAVDFERVAQGYIELILRGLQPRVEA